MRKPTDREAATERGSAMITVLVFTLGVLAMIAFLLPTTRKSVEAEGEMQRSRGLSFVLQTGINDAMNEMIEGDADGDGIGARGTGLPSNNPVMDPTSPSFAPGIEVNVGGTSLGFYKTWIDDTNLASNGTLDLVVIAVWPDFKRPRQTLSSRVRFRSQYFIVGDRNALTIAGVTDIGGGGNFGYSAPWTGELKVEEPSNTYPAINISDPKLWSMWVDGVDGGDADMATFGSEDGNTDTGNSKVSITEDWRTTIKGWDKNAAPGTPGTGQATITNLPSQNSAVNEVVLTKMVNAWRSYASFATTTTDITGDTSGGSTFTSGYSGPIDIGNINSSAGTPTDVVRLAPGKNNVTLDGVTVKGTGTLVVPRNLLLTNGAKIEWTGNIIVAPDGTTAQGKIQVQDGEIKLQGNLVLAPDPAGNKPAIAEFNKSKVDVTGSVLALTAGTGNAQLNLQNSGSGSPDVKVDGILGLLGSGVDYDIKGSIWSKAKLHVKGSAILAAPQSGTGFKSFKLESRSHTHIKFDDPKFTAALAGIVPPGNPPPPFFNRMGYLEAPAGALKGTGAVSTDWTGELKAFYDAVAAKLDGTSTIGTP